MCLVRIEDFEGRRGRRHRLWVQCPFILPACCAREVGCKRRVFSVCWDPPARQLHTRIDAEKDRGCSVRASPPQNGANLPVIWPSPTMSSNLLPCVLYMHSYTYIDACIHTYIDTYVCHPRVHLRAPPPIWRTGRDMALVFFGRQESIPATASVPPVSPVSKGGFYTDLGACSSRRFLFTKDPRRLVSAV